MEEPDYLHQGLSILARLIARRIRQDTAMSTEESRARDMYPKPNGVRGGDIGRNNNGGEPDS